MDGTPESIEVVTDHGNYSADQMVFTCGAWMSEVLRDERVQVRLERIPMFWQQATQPDLFGAGSPAHLPVAAI